MKSTTFIMNFVMLAIFVAMVATAATYPPQARFMPFVVGVPAIALCLLQIVLDIRAARRRTVEVEDTRSDVAKAQDAVSHYAGRSVQSEAAAVEVPTVIDATSVPPGAWRREILLWGYFLGFVGSVLLLGFWFTIPVFLILFLRNEAKLSWRNTLITGAIATTILYLAVERGLKVDLHDGFLTTYVLERFDR